MRSRLFAFWILALVVGGMSSEALANMPNQMNVNLGVDMPADDADVATNSGLLRFQLQTPPKIFRLHTAFTAAMGSGRRMGEFSGGFALYFLGKALENSSIQPFIGAEGIGAFGQFDNEMTITGGYGLFTGADLKIFDKKSGISLAIEYTQVQQQSLRIWLGLFFLKL